MFFNLDQIANDEGKIAILAMDQRGTLRSMLGTVGMPSSDDDLSSFKVDVVRALSPRSSGVLLDVEYGVGAVRQAGALASGAGLLISSERSPQPTWNSEYRTEFSPDRGPAFVEAAGGVALKFLVRWRPDRPPREGEPDLAQEALDAVRAVVDACRQHGMPSVIEPLVAALPGEGPLTAKQKRKLVVRSAELLSTVGPDLLKLEWPGDDAGCLEITRVCGSVPWALLSAGIEYEKFVERVVTAMDAGASGFIAGRALWGEAVGLPGAERSHFLKTIAVERMAGLAEATDGRGRSWQEVTRA